MASTSGRAAAATSSRAVCRPGHRLRVAAGVKDAVTVEDLVVSFGQGSEHKAVINKANLHVKRGSLHMLLGPNGCGKVRVLLATTCCCCVPGLMLSAWGPSMQIQLSRAQQQGSARHSLRLPFAVNTAQGAGRPGQPCLRSDQDRPANRLCIPEPRPPSGHANSGCRRGFWSGQVSTLKHLHHGSGALPAAMQHQESAKLPAETVHHTVYIASCICDISERVKRS